MSSAEDGETISEYQTFHDPMCSARMHISLEISLLEKELLRLQGSWRGENALLHSRIRGKRGWKCKLSWM